MEIDQNSEFEEPIEGIIDPVEIAVHKFRNHPSVQRIKEVVGVIEMEHKFNFENYYIGSSK